MTKLNTIPALETLRQRILSDRENIRATLTLCGGTGCRASKCQDVIDAVKQELDGRGL